MARLTYMERLDRFRAELDCARQSEDSERAIVGLIADSAFDGSSRSSALAALGGTTGSLGPALLRSELRAALGEYAFAARSRSYDCVNIACACIGALERRDGPAATPEYLEAERHANNEVHDAGLTAVAAHGDDRVWDDWLARLTHLLINKSSSGRRNRDVIYITRSLARHSAQGSDRAARLISLLRARWNCLQEPGWVEYQWPGIRPGGKTWEDVDLTVPIKAPRPGPPKFARRVPARPDRTDV